MLNKINDAKEKFLQNIEKVDSAKLLEELRIKFLSRNGIVSMLFEEFKSVPSQEKRAIGQGLNALRQELQAKYEALKTRIESKGKASAPEIDLTLPGRAPAQGTAHLITQTMNEIISIFKKIGFSVITGPEIESDRNNFGALNFPEDHPARDMQDTFFINRDFLLRTHTSPVQVRIMESQEPPVRAIMPGRVYRNEAINSRSYCMFHQIEGLFVDENVTFCRTQRNFGALCKRVLRQQC